MEKDKDNNNTMPLAIVGIGCLFPKANNPKEYWHNVRDGVDAIREIPDSHWNPTEYFNDDKNAPDMTYARRGGFIDPVDFDPLLYGLSPNNIEATDTTQLLGMVVARQALLDAGYSTSKDNIDGRQFDRNRTSVILGVTGTLELVIPLGARLGHPHWRKALADAGVAKDTAEEVVQRIADSYVPWQENSFPGLLGNVAAGRIANRFDLGGTNCVVDAACASSLSAIHMAAMELYLGRSDMAITGGFDTFNDIFMYMCFSKTPALSPTGNSRPFDINGDGTILGEGLGAVILKRLDDAKRDNDNIYAILKGMGSSSDGRGNAIYAPSANGQTRALKNAYTDAGVSPRSIELVEAHGTGTRVGDAVEAEALSSVYREDREEGTWCALGSVKSMIGHTKAGAGIAGLIKIAMALKHNVLPPTIKIDEPLDILNPGAAPVYVNTYRRPWLSKTNHPRRAALSAFGFGGSNFHCVMEEADPLSNEIDWDGSILIYSFSAKTRTALVKTLKSIDTEQSWDSLRYHAACSNKKFKQKDTPRLVLVITRQTEVKTLINDVCLKLNDKENTSWSLSNTAYYGEGKLPGKLAVLFPGQGSQYTNMQLDLACQFYQVQNSIANATQIFEEIYPENQLGEQIYPISVFTQEAKQKNTATLRHTQTAQPAIGAVSIGLFNLLKTFGISPDMTAGHSFGELTALCAGGVIDENSLIQLAIKRGELMANDNNGDHGSMLAVSASAAVVHEILEAEQLDLIIANNNAPRQVVLSGATDQIDRAVEVLGKRGLGAKKLPVSAAFHSSFIADAEKPFAKFLKTIKFSSPGIPVFSNSTSQTYPYEPEKAQALLASQLARPVEFVAEIENLYEAGVRTFIEVGPGNVITGLVNSILGDRSFNSIAIDASRGRKNGQYDLACTLAQIACLGHKTDLGMWDCDYINEFENVEERSPSMTIKLTGANYMKPRETRPPSNQNKPVTDAGEKQVLSTPVISKIEHKTPSIKNQDLLAATQKTILTLQNMQHQTADLHRQYLEGQEAAQKAIQSLLEQQAGTQSGVLPQTMSIPEKNDMATPVKVTNPPKSNVEPNVAELVSTNKQETVTGEDKTPELESLLLEVVSEKTGYPVDMLSLEMSLDTDLGIDSIKRVEILSSLHEKLPGAEMIQPEDLGTFRLLKHIAEFLVSNSGQEPISNDIEEPTLKQNSHTQDAQRILFQVVSDKTGYPIDMLNADMNLDTDLGIDSIKRVEILSAFQEQVPEAPAMNPEDLATLQTLQQIIDYISSSNTSIQQTDTSQVSVQSEPLINTPELVSTLLSIVADKTGYPIDMLKLEMNLDTDLGIDSIKRVEILSAFQEQVPEAPVMNPDNLGTLQTLQQIVEYMQQSAPITANPVVSQTNVSTSINGPEVADLTEALMDVVAEKTGYPVDMLELDMNLDTDLGIDSIKRVEILSAFQEKMPHAPSLNPDDLAKLQTLKQIIEFMHKGEAVHTIPVIDKQRRVEIDVETDADQKLWRGVLTTSELSSDRESVSINKDIVLLVTDDGTEFSDAICQILGDKGYTSRKVSLKERHDEKISGLIIVVPDNINEEGIADTLELIQHHANNLKEATQSDPKLLVSISKMGGTFGIDTDTDFNPESAAIGGFIKTADKEWTNVICRSIDVDGASQKMVDELNGIVDQLFYTSPLETCIQGNQALSINLLSTEGATKNPTGKKLPKLGETIVISGGARGITAEIAVELASEFGTNLLLLGRSSLPDDEPQWLSGITKEKDITQAIIQNSDSKLTPKEVKAKASDIHCAREIRLTLEKIRAQKVNVQYLPLDIRDTEQVKQALETARRELGPIVGIVHGAGVLADRLLEDKTREQFSNVYSTKVSGFKSLLAASRDDNLKVLLTFSSTTARFGRKGQSDYAAANEVLNKMSQQESRVRRDCRVISLNWGPWDGGMVTPQLRKLFEKEGIGVIPLRAGARQVVTEMKTGADVEIIILGSEPPNLEINTATKVSKTAIGNDKLHLAYERIVSINELPVLKSHIMNGKAVLPAAIIIEWFAHGALHNNPGLSFIGIDGFKIFKGVIVDADEHITVQIMTGDLIEDSGQLFIPVELRQGNNLHAGANVVLDNQYSDTCKPEILGVVGNYPRRLDEVYNNGMLFHGSDLQGLTDITAYSENGISGTSNTAPQPSSWMAQPIRKKWLGDPLVLDSAFQLMILWSFENSGAGSLPTSLDGYRLYKKSFADAKIIINIKIHKQNKNSIRAGIEFVDTHGQLVAKIEDYECVVDGSLNSAFKNNRLMDETQS